MVPVLTGMIFEINLPNIQISKALVKGMFLLLARLSIICLLESLFICILSYCRFQRPQLHQADNGKRKSGFNKDHRGKGLSFN